MFIAGVSNITEPPVNDIWTIKGEEHMLKEWVKEDSDYFNMVDMIHFHCLQIEDFLDAILNDKEPLVTGEDGRKNGRAVHSDLPFHR